MAELIPNIVLPPDFRGAAFTFFAAFVSALLFGLAPALQSTRADLARAARGEFSSDVRPMRLRNALVICQITVSALLLICSGVLIRGARYEVSMSIFERMAGSSWTSPINLAPKSWRGSQPRRPLKASPPLRIRH